MIDCLPAGFHQDMIRCYGVVCFIYCLPADTSTGKIRLLKFIDDDDSWRLSFKETLQFAIDEAQGMRKVKEEGKGELRACFRSFDKIYQEVQRMT